MQEKVFFESFLGRSYSDSPKVMYEYLRDNNYNYKFVWSLRDVKILDDNTCITTKKMSLGYLYHLATSKYIINNSRMPLCYSKRRGQIYIQTWHGTPLKHLVFDMDNVLLPNIDKESYFKNFKKDIDDWDYLLSPNKFSTEKFKSAFRFTGKFIEHGYPRNEELLTCTNEEVKILKKKLNIPVKNKVILYAPTFRDNNFISKGKYIQDINIDFDKIDMKNTTFIIRNHYLIKHINYKYGKNINVIDLTDYKNINDLFKVSDVLVTDYSSVFFDYMLLNKPIIFYQYDQELYANELRGVYIPVEELPGKVVIKEKDFYIAINTDKQNLYSSFNKKYQVLNNEAEITKKTIMEIFS